MHFIKQCMCRLFKSIGVTMEFKESIFNLWKKEDGIYLLFNTYSKSLAKITEKNYQKIMSYFLGEFNNGLSTDIIEKLLKNGFIIHSHIDEKKLLRYKYRQSYFSNDYLFITLLVTLRCNFACSYCFETEKKMRFNDNKIEVLKNFSKYIFPSKERIHISLFGGEPLTEIENIVSYLTYVNNLRDKFSFHYDTSIITNGFFLNKDIINLLSDKYNCKSFHITIDGNRKTHNRNRKAYKVDSYYTVLKNLKSLLKKNESLDRKLSIKLRINLLNNTIKEIESLLNEFTENEKYNFYIYFRPVYNTNKFCTENYSKKSLESFYILAKEKGYQVDMNRSIQYNCCEGDSGINQIQIMPNLTIWKCINDLNYNISNIGSIQQDGKVKWDNANLEKWSRNDPFDDDKCLKCKLLPICYGGCPLFFHKTNKRKCMFEKKFNLFSLYASTKK